MDMFKSERERENLFQRFDFKHVVFEFSSSVSFSTYDLNYAFFFACAHPISPNNAEGFEPTLIINN